MQSHLVDENKGVFLRRRAGRWPAGSPAAGRRRRAVGGPPALLLVLFLTGCATATTPPPCNPGTQLVNPTLWMQSAAEYRAAARQTYSAAQRALDAALAQPSSRPRAVILDLDETALDNSRYAARMIEKGAPFSFGSNWSAWVSESASGAIPGVQEFLLDAQSRGVTPVYITNRTTDMEAATRANLEKLGFPLAADTLILRAPDATTDKSARRNDVASRYDVVLLLGDDINDFTPRATLTSDAPWGTRWFILPNAIYGSWQSATPCDVNALTE
jgi:5'-nucleotidase (lipoprotein e(P4) family)